MSRFAHKTKSPRKIITLQEWAAYIGVSKPTLLSYLHSYQQDYEYDPHDIYSVLDFFTFLMQKRKEKSERRL